MMRWTARARRAAGAASLGARAEWARGNAWLLIVPGILLTAGLLMIYSASAGVAKARHGDAAYYFTHQVRWALLGLVALAAGAWVDYHRWRRLIVPLTLGALVLLATVLVAGWAVNGSRRWFHIAGVSVQPSEAARLVLVIYLAHYLVKRADAVASLRGLAPALAVVGAGMGLIWLDRKSTRLNSSHIQKSRMPSSA